MTTFLITGQRLQNGIMSISMKGFLDIFARQELEQSIKGYFEQNVYKLVVDMSEVEYMNGAGAGVLIGAAVVAQKNRGDVILVRPRAAIKDVFNLLRISQLFTITNSLKTAFEIFGKEIKRKII